MTCFDNILVAEKLKLIANGESVMLNLDFADEDMLEDLADLLNESILMLVPPAEEE